MKTIVHIIDSLPRGGAETLLIDLLPIISKDYRIILVTLSPLNEFGNDVFGYCEKHYCLNHKGPTSLPQSIIKLRRIIRKHRPALVRSQLVLSTVLARLSTPRHIPLVFSIHNTLSSLIPKTIPGKIISWIERNVRRKNVLLIGVTQAIINDYRKHFGYKGESTVLYNYVRDDFFTLPASQSPVPDELRLLAVGNLRLQKNYPFILDAFLYLKDVPVRLDIYGDGVLRPELEKTIEEEGLQVTLKGKVANVAAVMPSYDAFLMLSSFEGFGIAVAEAMAANMPVILSDIPVLREITQSRAIFVSLDSTQKFAEQLRQLVYDRTPLQSMVMVNRHRAEKYYSRDAYLKELHAIYEKALTGFSQ
jgi:glycosyltransferase involved in cell wall biosynthesis